TNAKNVGELLDMLTVYDLSHYAGLGSQKTLRLRNSTADQVLVLLDGVPLNSSAKGSFNLSLLPIDIVEKIEILPGSASALYGANAVAGVVNIITKKSREVKPQIQPKVNYGSFNTYSVDVDFDYNSTNYGTKVCLTNKHTDGWRENSQYDSISGFVNFSLPILYGELNMNLLTNSSKLGVPGPTTVPMEKWDGEVEKQASYPYAKQYDDVYFLSVSYKDKLVTTKFSVDKEKLLYDNSKDPVVWYQEKTNSEVVSVNVLNTISLPYQFSASLNYNYSQLDQQYLLNPVDNFKKDISDLSYTYNTVGF
ncbi:MAG: TonB-dependent receptor plug domain-containing protein, partial [candidate division WOR-3 bacterium]